MNGKDPIPKEQCKTWYLKTLDIEKRSHSVYFLAFQNDPRFRKYVQLVDKNLQSFDAVNEWADIISFLGRLLKVNSKG
jgi:hypothetical protein